MIDLLKRFVFKKAIRSLKSERSAILAEKEGLHDWKVGHYRELIELNKASIENATSEQIRRGWEMELAENVRILGYHQKQSDELASRVLLIDKELEKLGGSL